MEAKSSRDGAAYQTTGFRHCLWDAGWDGDPFLVEKEQQKPSSLIIKMSSKQQFPSKSQIPVKVWNLGLPVGPFTWPLYLSNIMIAIILDNLGQRREFGRKVKDGAGDKRPLPPARVQSSAPLPCFPSSSAIRDLLCFICCDLPSPHLFLHLNMGFPPSSHLGRGIVTSSLCAGERKKVGKVSGSGWEDRKVGKTSWREVMGKASGHFHPAGQGLGQIAEFDLQPLFLFSSVNFLRKQDDKNHSALLWDTNRPYSEIFTLYIIATQHHKACGSVRNIRVPLHLPSEWMLVWGLCPQLWFPWF